MFDPALGAVCASPGTAAASDPGPCLTAEQLASLRADANGISFRFEERVIVNALVAAGYAEKNLVGVVKVTAKGREHLDARQT